MAIAVLLLAGGAGGALATAIDHAADGSGVTDLELLDVADATEVDVEQDVIGAGSRCSKEKGADVAECTAEPLVAIIL